MKPGSATRGEVEANIAWHFTKLTPPKRLQNYHCHYSSQYINPIFFFFKCNIAIISIVKQLAIPIDYHYD